MKAPAYRGTVGPPDGIKWVAVDFDDTLSQRLFNAETGENALGPPVTGSLRKCRELVEQGWKVVIHTSRPWYDYEAIEEWLNRHGYPYSRIVCGKLMAAAYIDDKNILVGARTWVPREAAT